MMSSAVCSLTVLALCGVIVTSEALFLDKLLGPSEALSNSCPGVCVLCTTCWLGGGRVQGSCGGVYACCVHQKSYAVPTSYNAAEARKISSLWYDHPNSSASSKRQKKTKHPEVLYGPVLNDRHCGLPTISHRRVVGGSEAGFGRFPWQALVRIGMSRCGGALINQRHVLTAGHCVHAAGRRVDTLRVYLGEYTLHNDLEPLPSQEFSVEKIHKHPYYQFTPQADRFDIAVLRLSRPVLYAPHISPSFEEGLEATVAGWGAMKPDSLERPVDLQAARVKIVNSTRCELWHEKNNIKVHIYDDMLCAGHKEGGIDACQGDSGGPLMTQVHADGVKRWTLVGLVSAGYSCAKPGQPGIYHKVAKTADWVSYVSQLH